MEKQMNWAVLGTGVIANEMAQALQKMGKRLYGVGNRTHWKAVDFAAKYGVEKVYDRMGLDNEYTEILGNKVPVLTIPVKPGRNLAVIIEVAAMNNRQKKMGYNAATELLKGLGMDASILQEESEPKKLDL